MKVSTSMRRSSRGFMSIDSIFWIWWQDTARVMFSRIDPLIDEKRRDRAMRFVALIFLLHDGEVQVTQYNSDIEIELPHDETD